MVRYEVNAVMLLAEACAPSLRAVCERLCVRKGHFRNDCHQRRSMTNDSSVQGMIRCLLVVARKLTTSREVLLWMTPSEAPKALQASECSELLDPTRASCRIAAQH